MAVKFEEIVFHNENGIAVSLTVEAPVGQVVVREHEVPGKSTYRVQPGVDYCASALVAARAAGHGDYEDRQSFTASANPQQAYIAHLTTRHVIGSIHGSFVGSTERGR